jgi:rod shape-determining protein RodA
MQGSLRRYLRYTSWPIIAAMIALMVMGILSIDASEQADPTIRGFTAKQTVYAMLGLAAFLGATVFPYQRVGRMAYSLFALTLGLLVLVFLLPTRQGVHRWIDIGVFLIQPSEIAKLTYVVMLAWYLRYGNNYRRLGGLVVPFVLTLVPMGLILKEPDLGTSLLFLPTLYFMLFMAGAKLKHLLGIIAVATLVLLAPMPRCVSAPMGREEAADRRALAYWTTTYHGKEYVFSAGMLAMMESHQISRVVGWLRQDDPRVAKDKGYQLHQAKVVMGSGGLTGSADDEDSGMYFRMLPEDHTDFIFSVVGGQWGFLGCLAAFFLYFVIFLFGVEIAVITNDPFARLLAVGVVALLFTQMVINAGMTMGLMPITGMTLPFVSYGGSSLVINCAALGLLVNVGQHRPILLSKRPFEHREG